MPLFYDIVVLVICICHRDVNHALIFIIRGSIAFFECTCKHYDRLNKFTCISMYSAQIIESLQSLIWISMP